MAESAEHIDDATVRETDRVMKECGGDRATAAIILGISVETLGTRLYLGGLLKKWPAAPGSVMVPKEKTRRSTANTALALSNLKPTAEIDEEIAKRGEVLEAALLEIMDEGGASLARRLHTFQMQNAQACMEHLGAGIFRSTIQLLQLIDDLIKHPYADEKTPDGILLRDGQKATDEMVLKAQDAHAKRCLDFAQMELYRVKAEKERYAMVEMKKNGAQRKGKPGFGPALKSPQTNVLVSAGAHVNIGQQQPPEARPIDIPPQPPHNQLEEQDGEA